MSLFYQPQISEGVMVLSVEESRHAVKVLRMSEGDLIELTDGTGTLYKARITKADAGKCAFLIMAKETQKARSYKIHIAIAPTKNIDRMEWFVEKSTELGIDEISFMECSKSERRSVNMDRLEKLAVSAMKQSGQSWLPSLHPMRPFAEIVSSPSEQRFIAFVDIENPDGLKSVARKGGDYLVLIGPEGDFSAEELTSALLAGFQKVSLGPTRLRTETAGLAACLTLHLVNQ